MRHFLRFKGPKGNQGKSGLPGFAGGMVSTTFYPLALHNFHVTKFSPSYSETPSYGHLVITATFFWPDETPIHFLIRKPRWCGHHVQLPWFPSLVSHWGTGVFRSVMKFDRIPLIRPNFHGPLVTVLTELDYICKKGLLHNVNSANITYMYIKNFGEAEYSTVI